MTSHQPDDDLVRRYVAGKADPAEAESFEEHYFACDLCWREVEAAIQLREAVSTPALKPARRMWPLLAAAAVAAFLFVGVWQMVQQQSDREPAWRSSQPAYSTRTQRVGSDIVIFWDPRPEARWYVVHRFSPDGTVLDATQVRAPQTELSLPTNPEASHYRVQALDQFRTVLADSGLRPMNDQ